MSRIRHIGSLLAFVLLTTTAVHAEDPVVAGPAAHDVVPLIEALASDDLAARRKAVFELWNQRAHARTAVPALAVALRDEDEYVRTTAERVLTTFDWQAGGNNALHAAIPELLVGLGDERLAVRRAAIGLLWRVGPTLDKAPPGLIAGLEGALDSDDPQVRARAAATAGNLMVRAKALGPALARCLRSEDKDVRMWAAQAIGMIDPTSQLGALIAILDDPDATVRTTAVGAMTGLGSGLPGLPKDIPPGTLAALRKVLRDPVASVRSAAAGTVWNLELRDAVPDLITMLRSDTDLNVRADAALALGGLGSPEALGPLAATMFNAHPRLRANAAVALGQLGPEGAAALPMLRKAVSDPDMGVACSALRAISYLGSHGAPAKAEVLVALSHETTAIRDTAAQAVLALVRAGVRDDDVVDQLRSAILDQSAMVRTYALQAVGALGDRGAPLVPILIDGLKSAEGSTIQLYVSTLASLGRVAADAVPTLRSIEVERQYQWCAVRGAIGRVAPDSDAAKQAIADLASALTDPKRQSVALYWLGRIGAPAESAIPAIEELLGDKVLRATAAQTLIAIAPTMPENALLILTRYLEEQRGGVLRLAFDDVDGRRLRGLVPHLLPYASAESGHARRAVAEVLGRAGVDSPAVRAALAKARHDPQAAVRLAAAEALKRLPESR